MSARMMSARFPSTCYKCMGIIHRGDSIYYDKSGDKGRKAWHVKCHDDIQPQQDQQPTPAPAPAPARIRDNGRESVSFDSAAAILDTWRAEPVNAKNRAHWRFHGHKHGGSDWIGIDGTPQDVARIASEGWLEGLQRMRDALRDLGDITPPQSVRRRRVWTDHGDSVDMQRVYAGRSDVAFSRCARVTRTAPAVVTLVCNTSIGHTHHPDELFWRGAAAAAVSDALTEAGYHVRIVLQNYGKLATTHDPILDLRVILKDERSPLDLSTLCGTLCLPGFTRSIVYGAMFGMDKREIDGHLNIPKTYTAAPGEIAGFEQCKDAESARAFVIATLESFANGREPLAA